MSIKTLLAAVGTVALSVGFAASGALADAPPAAGKKAYKAPAKEAYKAPAKAEHYERPHVGNWGGLYFGVNAGFANSSVDWAYVTPPGGANSFGGDETEFALGGHVGIQHQFDRIVVGIEVGYSGVGAFGDGWRGNSCPNPAFNCVTKADSFLTIGPRLGLAMNDWMFYLTGGYAIGQLQSRGEAVATPLFIEQTSHHHDGWFFGGGFERVLHDRWVWGLEYQHISLDAKTHCVNSPCVPANILNRNIDGDVDLFRFRLSYKLGRESHGAAAPTK